VLFFRLFPKKGERKGRGFREQYSLSFAEKKGLPLGRRKGKGGAGPKKVNLLLFLRGKKGKKDE